jgi:hypothetical protein
MSPRESSARATGKERPSAFEKAVCKLAELSQLRAIFGIFAIIFAAKPCVSIGTL